MFSTEGEAKRFFVDKIIRQAAFENSPLSAVEQQMLSWSESDPELIPDLSLPEQLAAEISDEDYESKVAGLIQRAYARDIASDASAAQQYKEAHAVLNRGDHYVLIMIDQALKRHLRPWWKFSLS
ncbi:MAG TPA: hypothetical protein VHU41_14290 [Thermoanaerobaculia bacterium]|jgi:hypothetical protein|nr:hypothetical protein [Thermoanaerobaculia bacterium]